MQTKSQADEIERYAKARDQLRTHDKGGCKQEHRDVVPLYEEAARVVTHGRIKPAACTHRTLSVRALYAQHGRFGELVKKMEADGIQVQLMHVAWLEGFDEKVGFFHHLLQ